ncbi:MAG TPA: heparan-alpha-glucosaminide N-acetyltransferase domain-containing protein [Pyrinomonadaceae bacterium]
MATSVATNASPVTHIAYAGDVPPENGKPVKTRIDSIDLLRGIVMVIMMLDHTRDFIHNAVFQFDPLDPTRTNPILFFTRWITHFCAPTFVFLAGTGIYLQFARGKNKATLSRFLITRGLWLIFLEFTLVRLGAFFNVEPKLLMMMQVIWAIGVSMIVMAALIHLPLKVITGFGLLMIALHNLLDPFQIPRAFGNPSLGLWGKLWLILHQQGLFFIDGFPSPAVLVLYPLIPWVGVMAVGYAFGSIYRRSTTERQRLLFLIGLASIVLFIVIRAINLYGDPQPWQSQTRGFLYTVLSFLNTAKYPPSLLYLLMTLGPSILALAFFEAGNAGSPSGLRKFFVTFGRVPLFFYLLQWPTAHLISVLLHYSFGKPVWWLFKTPMDWNNIGRGVGFNLVVVYISWIIGVLLLYPLCKWFASLKQRRRDWWLSYL